MLPNCRLLGFHWMDPSARRTFLTEVQFYLTYVSLACCCSMRNGLKHSCVPTAAVEVTIRRFWYPALVRKLCFQSSTLLKSLWPDCDIAAKSSTAKTFFAVLKHRMTKRLSALLFKFTFVFIYFNFNNWKLALHGLCKWNGIVSLLRSCLSELSCAVNAVWKLVTLISTRFGMRRTKASRRRVLCHNIQ